MSTTTSQTNPAEVARTSRLQARHRFLPATAVALLPYQIFHNERRIQTWLDVF